MARQNVLRLRKQLEESKEITEVLIKQLQGKKEIIKKLETKIATTRMKPKNKNKQQDGSKILEEIINNQTSHFDKIGLGFDSKSNDKGIKEKHMSYIDALRGPPSQENQPHNHDFKNAWRQPTSRRTTSDSGYRHKERDDKNDWRQQSNRRATPRHPIKYQSLFPGNYYICYNFGHKAINCRTYQRKEATWNKRKNEGTTHYPPRNYNRFETLNKQIECSKCNNFGHIVRELRSKWTSFTKGIDYHHEECSIALQAQDKADHWCVDSDCSKHMT